MATAPTLLIDRIENARVRCSLTASRIDRAFIALDIDTSVPRNSLLNVLFIAGMPIPGELFPGTAFTRVTDIVVEPYSGTVARGVIVYEGPSSDGFGDGVPRFIAEKSSSLNQRTRQEFQIADGTWKPVQVKLDQTVTNASGSGSPTSTQTTIKTGSANVLLPMVSVILSRNLSPYPIDLPSFGTVNAAAMPDSAPWDDTPINDIGFWLFAGFDIKTQNQGVNYNYSCTLISMVDQDWSDLVYLRQPNGENVIVPASTMATLLALGYTNTLVQGVNGSMNAGVAKVGFYGVDDFTPFTTTNLGG